MQPMRVFRALLLTLACLLVNVGCSVNGSATGTTADVAARLRDFAAAVARQALAAFLL